MRAESGGKLIRAAGGIKWGELLPPPCHTMMSPGHVTLVLKIKKEHHHGHFGDNWFATKKHENNISPAPRPIDFLQKASDLYRFGHPRWGGSCLHVLCPHFKRSWEICSQLKIQKIVYSSPRPSHTVFGPFIELPKMTAQLLLCDLLIGT
jgi:hypothetical protein